MATHCVYRWVALPRFLMRPVDGGIRIWWMRNEVLQQDLVVETTAYGGGSVMVWRAICGDLETKRVDAAGKFGSGLRRWPLVVLRGTLNGEGYRWVLSLTGQFLRPLQLAWLLQDDNATPHRCQIVQRFHMRRPASKRFNWPARSADLNPTEHLCDELGRRVRKRSPISIARLETVLREEWEAIP